METAIKYTFEEKLEVIDGLLKKQAGKWNLKARPDLDFDDISQIIRRHIWVKWDKWDQDRPFEPWVNRLIHNQFCNLLRNAYLRFNRPCLKCPAEMGQNQCRLYGKQCASCPLYASWQKSGEKRLNVKLPLPSENHTKEIASLPCTIIDYPKAIERFNIRLKEKLQPNQWELYRLCFIEGKTRKEAATILGNKWDERENKNKTISVMLLDILKEAKLVLQEHGLE